MKWIVRGLIALVGLALIAVVGVSWYFWSLGADTIARAKADGWLIEAGNAPLTVFEQTVAKAEFAETWNRSAFPCRTIARGFSRGRGSIVSDAAVMAMPRIALPERTLESSMARASAACQLEWAHSDIELLRLWLKHAWITEHQTVEAASQALLGKPTSALDESEAARIAALLRGQRLWQQPEKWATRARHISETTREYVWVGDQLERVDRATR